VLTVGGITGSMQIEAVINDTEVYQDLFLDTKVFVNRWGYKSQWTYCFSLPPPRIAEPVDGFIGIKQGLCDETTLGTIDTDRLIRP